MGRHWVFALLLMLGGLPLLNPSSTYAADQRCFGETGQCISGRFRAYWEQNGGLAVFGFPISSARDEVNRDTGQTYLTQWFERNRIELHTENPAPYDVLLGRLGDDRLRQQNVDWRLQPAGERTSACLWFEQTKHSVCDQMPGVGFKTYWQGRGLSDPALDTYGRSLALFGLPLTEPYMETNSSGDTVLTQWFERARFEWHPTNPQAYKVLLGLLGNELRTAPTDTTVPANWTTRWLQSIPCAAPCWEGVTPGVTTVDETIRIWRQSPIISQAQEDSNRTVIQLAWRQDGTLAGGAAYRPTDRVIISIGVGYPTPFALQDLRSAFGEPSHVYAKVSKDASEQPFYRLSFVYLPKGLIVNALVADPTRPVLSEDMRVTSPTFVQASLEGLTTTMPQMTEKTLVPWKGFLDFSYYCRSADGSTNGCQ